MGSRKANEIGDVARLLKITGRTSINMEKPLITVAMGQMGIVTRIAGESFGSDITFGTVGESSAPGQLHVDDLKVIGTEVYKPITRPPQSWCYVEELII